MNAVTTVIAPSDDLMKSALWKTLRGTGLSKSRNIKYQ